MSSWIVLVALLATGGSSIVFASWEGWIGWAPVPPRKPAHAMRPWPVRAVRDGWNVLASMWDFLADNVFAILWLAWAVLLLWQLTHDGVWAQ